MAARTKRLALVFISLIVMPSGLGARDRCVVIGFREAAGAFEKALVRDARGLVDRTYSSISAVAATIPEESIEELKRHDAVLFVEESAIYRSAAAPGVSDEYRDSWGVRRALADLAHRRGNRGAGIRIAILDTGVDYEHEELDDNYSGGRDFVFDDSDPFDDSFNSHGTHIAGIIAAEGNGVGVVGVAPQAEILAVKVLDGAGFGTLDWIIAGIEWSVANGADVICMSLQGPDRQGLRAACDAARAAGVLLVAAAGNDIGGGGDVEYPAGYASVVAVTATDAFDVAADFAPVGHLVDLAAPGVDVPSTIVGGGYGIASGTSQAAAHAAGAVALYLAGGTVDLSGDGSIDTEDTRLMLLLTAGDLGNAGNDAIFGHGLVNVEAASTEGLGREVVITEATARGQILTIAGSGFGGYSPGAITSVRGTLAVAESETTVIADGAVVVWSDEEIVAEFPATPYEVAVRSVFGAATAGVRTAGDGVEFRRGDANADGALDVADAMHTLEYLFLGSRAPGCPDASDSDDNARLEIDDAVLVLGWLFLGGEEPAAPGPRECGTDESPDLLLPCDYEC